MGEAVCERAAARLAIRVLELDAVDDRARSRRGTGSLGLTSFSSSAAVVVTILNVEPGGWGAEKAIPARARTAPVRASRAAMPPKRPAERGRAASCTAESMVVRTGFGCLRPAARGRGPPRGAAHRACPRPAPRRSARARSRPRACRGRSRARRRRPARPRSPPVPASPAICAPAAPSGEIRASAGPSTSIRLSRARIFARGGSRRRARQRFP